MDALHELLEDFCDTGQSGIKPEIEGKLDESNKYVIRLPEQLSSKFSQLFQIIDQDKSKFNISQYNIRISTLEEVFNEIGR